MQETKHKFSASHTDIFASPHTTSNIFNGDIMMPTLCFLYILFSISLQIISYHFKTILGETSKEKKKNEWRLFFFFFTFPYGWKIICTMLQTVLNWVFFSCFANKIFDFLILLTSSQAQTSSDYSNKGKSVTPFGSTLRRPLSSTKHSYISPFWHPPTMFLHPS